MHGAGRVNCIYVMVTSQSAFASSDSSIETPEKCVKYV